MESSIPVNYRLFRAVTFALPVWRALPLLTVTDKHPLSDFIHGLADARRGDSFYAASEYPMNATASIRVRILRADPSMKARILLADDHLRFPEMEARLLEAEFEIVGMVNDGRALIEAAMRMEPDVVVTDISMPIMNGIEAVSRLHESGDRPRVVFLSVHTDTDFVRKCLSAGAFGYVVKSRMASELIPAIRHALKGIIFVSHYLKEVD